MNRLVLMVERSEVTVKNNVETKYVFIYLKILNINITLIADMCFIQLRIWYEKRIYDYIINRPMTPNVYYPLLI